MSLRSFSPALPPASCAHLQCTKHGLSSADASARLQQHGPNKLPDSSRNPILVFLGYVQLCLPARLAEVLWKAHMGCLWETLQVPAGQMHAEACSACSNTRPARKPRLHLRSLEVSMCNSEHSCPAILFTLLSISAHACAVNGALLRLRLAALQVHVEPAGMGHGGCRHHLYCAAGCG